MFYRGFIRTYNGVVFTLEGDLQRGRWQIILVINSSRVKVKVKVSTSLVRIVLDDQVTHHDLQGKHELTFHLQQERAVLSGTENMSKGLGIKVK